MQRLTYINLDDEQVVFHHAPFVLSKVGGLGIPDLKVETLRGVYQHGDTIAGLLREKRVVTVTFSVLAESRRLLYDYRMLLIDILSPDKAAQGSDRARLIYENDQGKYMTYAVPDGGLDANGRFLNAQPNIKLDFRCESPYWYDDYLSELKFAYSAGTGFALPFSFPVSFGLRDYTKSVTNRGQVNAPVQITIACKGEAPSLYNSTTGKRLALAIPVPEGQTLILNTDPARLDAHMIDILGREVSAFGRLSLVTPLADFYLAPGVNGLVYEPGGANAQSELTVAWRNAYEGV
jgi:hypothetical protein